MKRKNSLIKNVHSRRKHGEKDRSHQSMSQKSNSLQLSAQYDDEISSESDSDVHSNEDIGDRSTLSPGDEETFEQKRKRLATEYLSNINADIDGNDSDSSNDGMISSHLKTARLSSQGRLFRDLTSAIECHHSDDFTSRSLSGHEKSVTGIALTSDEKIAFSCAKDSGIIKWDIETGQKDFIRNTWSKNRSSLKSEYDSELLAIEISSDNRYVACGGRDKCIRLYDARVKHAEIHIFEGHRDAVTSLSFRHDSNSLFSGSLDRCIKHWDIAEKGYVETLFGHQDGILSLDCWQSDRPLSSSSDRTIRFWKVSDESHMVFRVSKSSIDMAKLISDDSFVSVGQDGGIQYWKSTQKRPVANSHAIHGFEDSRNMVPRTISSLAVVKFSNLAATGSFDGSIRLWELNTDSRQVRQIQQLPANGFINDIAITPSIVVAGMGKEHKFGRWWSLKGNLNKVLIYRIPKSS